MGLIPASFKYCGKIWVFLKIVGISAGKPEDVVPSHTRKGSSNWVGQQPTPRLDLSVFTMSGPEEETANSEVSVWTLVTSHGVVKLSPGKPVSLMSNTMLLTTSCSGPRLL